MCSSARKNDGGARRDSFGLENSPNPKDRFHARNFNGSLKLRNPDESLRVVGVWGESKSLGQEAVMSRFQILAISGSLRARSSNTELLKAAALVAPESICVTLYDGL